MSDDIGGIKNWREQRIPEINLDPVAKAAFDQAHQDYVASGEHDFNDFLGRWVTILEQHQKVGAEELTAAFSDHLNDYPSELQNQFNDYVNNLLNNSNNNHETLKELEETYSNMPSEIHELIRNLNENPDVSDETLFERLNQSLEQSYTQPDLQFNFDGIQELSTAIEPLILNLPDSSGMIDSSDSIHATNAGITADIPPSLLSSDINKETDNFNANQHPFITNLYESSPSDAVQIASNNSLDVFDIPTETISDLTDSSQPPEFGGSHLDFGAGPDTGLSNISGDS